MWVGCVWCAGFPAPLDSLLWRLGTASALMAPLVYVVRPHSLILLVPAMLPAIAVYVTALILLGAFSSDDVRLARECIDFARPFLGSWSRQLQRKSS
jgi:hypothetical protein